MHRILADPTLFLNIGDPTRETPNPPHLKNFSPDARNLQQADVIVSMPKDEARWSYSCRLINLSAMFLIGHEIAHISCGHVDYLSSKTGTPFLVELGWVAPNPITHIERQVM